MVYEATWSYLFKNIFPLYKLHEDSLSHFVCSNILWQFVLFCEYNVHVYEYLTAAFFKSSYEFFSHLIRIKLIKVFNILTPIE